MPAEAYTLRLVAAPGKTYDCEQITRAQLAAELTAIANGLIFTDTPLDRLTVEVARAERPNPVYHRAVELHDDLAVDELAAEIYALERGASARGGDDAAN